MRWGRLGSELWRLILGVFGVGLGKPGVELGGGWELNHGGLGVELGNSVD